MRFIGIYFFFQPNSFVSCKVTIQNIKMLYFRNERCYATGNLKKDLFMDHLVPPLDKNSEDLVIMMLLSLLQTY